MNKTGNFIWSGKIREDWIDCLEVKNMDIVKSDNPNICCKTCEYYGGDKNSVCVYIDTTDTREVNDLCEHFIPKLAKCPFCGSESKITDSPEPADEHGNNIYYRPGCSNIMCYFYGGEFSGGTTEDMLRYLCTRYNNRNVPTSEEDLGVDMDDKYKFCIFCYYGNIHKNILGCAYGSSSWDGFPIKGIFDTCRNWKAK